MGRMVGPVDELGVGTMMGTVALASMLDGFVEAFVGSSSVEVKSMTSLDLVCPLLIDAVVVGFWTGADGQSEWVVVVVGWLFASEVEPGTNCWVELQAPN